MPKNSEPKREVFKRPAEGVEKQIELTRNLVGWCFSDPKLMPGYDVKPEGGIKHRQLDYKSEAELGRLPNYRKVIEAVTILEGAEPGSEAALSKGYFEAQNLVRSRGFDPESTEDRKLMLLTADAVKKTLELIENRKNGEKTGDIESVAGGNFNQAWKLLMETAIVQMKYTREQSYQLFDAVFDDMNLLDRLAEVKSVSLANGLEGELWAYWFFAESGLGKVKFSSRDHDERDKVDLVFVYDKKEPGDNEAGVVFVQVKSTITPRQSVVMSNEVSKKEYRGMISNIVEGSRRRKAEKNFDIFERYIEGKKKGSERKVEGMIVFGQVRREKADTRKAVATRSQGLRYV